MKAILIPLVFLCSILNVHALPFNEGMITMALVKYGGKNINPHDSFGVLLITSDPTKADFLPLISFQSFIFEKWNNECIATQSDINEINIESEFINFQGKEAINASTNNKHMKYNHSFLLTDISNNNKQKYRLEVTRFFKSKKIKSYVWVYEPNTHFIDTKTSPCIGKINYTN